MRSKFYTVNTIHCIFCDRQARCTLSGLRGLVVRVETTRRRVIGRSFPDVIRNGCRLDLHFPIFYLFFPWVPLPPARITLGQVDDAMPRVAFERRRYCRRVE